MTFWQLTINAKEPARLAQFWAAALGYTAVPPGAPDTSWNRHYRARLGDSPAFADRIFDPEGLRPPIWFQPSPEERTGPNRLHLDLYPTGRDTTLTYERMVEIVDARVAELVELGATVERSEGSDDPDDAFYWVVLNDPEGNVFCVS
ncbi:VOC family protein [Cryptosporangium phraense]|uniref:VOC family protein n=1 Tax=Cryptosporangium phraense TaxID=2593070 RepID=A0A545AFK6_9ACTN|nr:VOC family protein [Cryptosporangium phraense]TQS40114.1 VOC family protein [Cryptosporangium phraense]